MRKGFGPSVRKALLRGRRKWEALVTPSVALPPYREQQARFLATLLLVMLPVTLIVSVAQIASRSGTLVNQPEFWLTLVGDAGVGVAYLVCRRGAVRLATYFILGVASLITFAIALWDASEFETNYMVYLILLTIVGSAFLSLLAVEIITVVNFIVAAVILFAIPPTGLSSTAVEQLSFYIVATSTVILVTRFRAKQEAVRNDEVLAEQARYQSLFEATFEAILVYKQGVYVDVNPAFEELFGYKRAEVIGQNIALTLPEYVPTANDSMQQGQGERRFESVGRRKDGTIFPMIIYSKPIVYRAQEMWIAAVRDLTATRQTEQERLDLAIQRNRVNLLENLLNDLSHDLKTPIASISLKLAILEMVQDTADREKEIDLMKKQLAQIEQMMESILLMSRLEQGMLHKNEPVQLNAIAEDVAQWLQLQAAAREITLRLELDPAMPTLAGDFTALWRMLLNLVKNSIIYSGPQRTVVIGTGVEEGQVVLKVQDQGFGIAPEEIAHIFDRHYRSPHAQQVEGTGLGLAIVKAIVEAHHGQIEVESVPSQGTIFYVRLPLTA